MNEAKYNKYKDFYTKDYLMNPNSFLLLDELVSENAAALGGRILIAVPGIRYEPAGKELELFKEWAENGDHELFHTAEWWKNHLLKNTDGQIEINVTEGKCYDKAWNDWFKSGNDYGVRDKEYLDKGLYDLLNFVMISIKKV